ncbi:uracil-DNA glycosylase family protein [Oceanibaculum nanhaiense]|uniref:uracil-DNA glycosylase family protein n=1 Tax=Oceanibaculum nanhaiense TaxID=1909734 RepID=UPI003D2A08D8
MVGDPLPALLREISACRLCEAHLPLGPRPVIRAAASARILVIGQAPGTKVHRTGIPFNDPSGDRLRDWMGIDRDIFYDEARIAIMPMGLCYPGRNARGGDLPPRPECAPLWHDRVRALLPAIELTLLIGAYAQARYLGARREKTLAGTVARWRDFGPAFIPTPHPSPRNRNWLKTHPWFEDEVVPEIRRRVAALV